MREEGRRKKEKKEKFRYGIDVWKSCLEHLLDISKETIVRMLVWNCLETLVLEILV